MRVFEIDRDIAYLSDLVDFWRCCLYQHQVLKIHCQPTWLSAEFLVILNNNNEKANKSPRMSVSKMLSEIFTTV